MTFKTAAQLFGDGGVNGAAVPYSTTNPPGTAAANRGIQFGEQLTAAIANRTHYALALNDEDVNTRLVVFETDGLDAAYRLGAVALAGGGRVITLDGGAVETQSALAAAQPDAHYRADASSDSVDGGVGFEFKGRNTSTGGAPRHGFLDRRGTSFNTSKTIIAYPNAATLNPAGVGATRCTLGGGGQTKDGGNNTDLILGLDLVEILAGAHKGLYVAMTLPTSTSMTLANLNGSAPSFTADAVVSIRLYRPTMASSGPYSHSGSMVSRGLTLAGMPTDDTTDAVLKIVPGAKDGPDGTGADGMRHALKIIGLNSDGTPFDVITAYGSGRLDSSASTLMVPSARRLAGTDFGNPAFSVLHVSSLPDYEASFIGRLRVAGAVNYFGMAALEVAGATSTEPFTFPASGTASGTGIRTDAGVRTVSRGQVIEIVTPSPQAGIYQATNVETDGRVVLRRLDGDAVTGFPTNGSAGTYRRYTGAIAGRQRFPTCGLTMLGGAPNQADASLVLHPPDRQSSGTSASDVALAIYADTISSYAIRVFGAESEKFSVNMNGFVNCQSVIVDSVGTVTTPGLLANYAVVAGDVDIDGELTIGEETILIDPPQDIGYRSIPTVFWRVSNLQETAPWWGHDNAPGGPQVRYSFSGNPNPGKIWIPVSITTPSFVEIDGARIHYKTTGFSGDTLRFRLVNVTSLGVLTELEDFGNLPAHAGAYSAATFSSFSSGPHRNLTFGNTIYLVVEPSGVPLGLWEFSDAAVRFDMDGWYV